MTPRINVIKVIVQSNSITLCTTSYGGFPERCYIEYKDVDQGCLVSTDNSLKPEEIVHEENFVDMFFEKFESTLALQTGVLQRFHVDLDCVRIRGKKRTLSPITRGDHPLLGYPESNTRDDYLPRVMNRLEQVLKKRHVLLKADTLRMNVGNPDHIFQILPYIDPKYLQFIIAHDLQGQSRKVFGIDEIVELDQFKQARMVELSTFTSSAPIEHFSHFKNCSIRRDVISCEDLTKLKKVFFNCKKFRQFETYYNRFEGKEDLIKVFGKAETGREYFFWEFSIPGSEEALFLNVVLCHPNTICFTRCSKFSPPQKGCVNCTWTI